MSEKEKQIHLYMHSKNELGLATLCVEKDKEIERLNNIINKAIDKAKTMKASMLIDTIDGIEIESKFVHNLYALIEYMENELKGVDKE